MASVPDAIASSIPLEPSMATDDSPVSKEQLLDFYRQMYLIRRVEELAAKAYTLRKILGFCHLYIGQEAVAVGATAALNPEDTVVTAYRDHGHILARGVDPKAMMAELFGKREGTTGGIGGSMHLASKAHNFFGGYGIVGGHIPLAVGAAFAAKYRKNGQISLCYFGDGAAQQGAFFESLALAQLWKLPMIFLCENNFYAMGTSLDRQSFLQEMNKRAEGVGMRNWQFHGFDVVEVYQNLVEAVAHVRSGQGPVMLEAVTYRYRGHSMSDPAKYRTQQEVDDTKEKRDCLKLAEERLRSDHGVSEDALEAIRDACRVIAQEAYDFADQGAPPDPSTLYDHVYAE